jgi:hypothetical protein
MDCIIVACGVTFIYPLHPYVTTVVVHLILGT